MSRRIRRDLATQARARRMRFGTQFAGAEARPLMRCAATSDAGPARLPTTEHVLLESEDRVVPQRTSARKVHARLDFRSRLRRRAFQLEVIDYYFLCVRIWRPRSLAADYVLDLRFIDANLHRSRHIAWRWMVAALALTVLFSVALWLGSAFSLYATLFALAACAGFVSLYRTTERWTLHSLHGKAQLLECLGGLGTLRKTRPFAAKLAAHLQIAIAARRPSKGQHLRDEMREHFRLKEAGVIGVEEYEASKVRILGTHGAITASRAL